MKLKRSKFIIINCEKRNITPPSTTNPTSSTVSSNSNSFNGTSIVTGEVKHGTSQPSSNKLASTIDKFTNTQLFTGLFFLSGPVVQEIPELVDLQNDIIQNAGTDPNLKLSVFSDRATNVVNKLNAVSPGFIDEFGKLIRTKDHQNILTAIDKAATILTDLGIELGGSADLADDGKKKRKLIIVRPFIIWQNKPFKADDGGETDLYESNIGKDQLVNSIVSSFQ